MYAAAPLLTELLTLNKYRTIVTKSFFYLNVVGVSKSCKTVKIKGDNENAAKYRYLARNLIIYL